MAWWIKLAIACVVALAAWCLASVSYAGTSDGSVGKITGVVLKDGKPLASVRVGIFAAKQKLGKKGRAPDADAAPATQPSDSNRAVPERPRRQILAETQTDSDGKFTLGGLKPGNYVVLAGGHGQGRGHQRVSVAAGQESAVEINVEAAPGNDGGATTQPSRPAREHKKFQKLGI
jgi:hypothetical protein